MNQPHLDDAETFRLDAVDDFSDDVFLDAVGLDDRQCQFHFSLLTGKSPRIISGRSGNVNQPPSPDREDSRPRPKKRAFSRQVDKLRGKS